MWIPLLVLGQVAALAVVAAMGVVLYRRAQRNHEGLTRATFERALASDQRADHLQGQLDLVHQELPLLHQRVDALSLQQRIDRARLMVVEARTNSLLPAAASARLSNALRQMADEASTA